MRILFVCTGNLCRSPVAERLAAGWARGSLAGSPELDRVEVLSAGLAAVQGRPMDPRSAQALAELGGDSEGFTSRPLTPDLAASADLVFTMTRDQRRSVLAMVPRGLRSTFTLREAVDLLDRANLTGLRVLPLEQRARELGRRLDAARAQRPTRATDDIEDPIGQRARVHEKVAGEIADALRPLTSVLLASVRAQPAVPLTG